GVVKEEEKRSLTENDDNGGVNHNFLNSNFNFRLPLLGHSLSVSCSGTEVRSVVLSQVEMETLRLISEQKIPRELERMDSFAEHFATSLDSVKVKAAETAQCHGKLWKLKSTLRDAEDEFVKVLSVKTRKEARQMALIDSINAVRNRLEELRRNLQIQTSRRDDYAGIISQLSLGNQNDECRGETQEALSWYNRVLGFQIECGRGVKFTFININVKNPSEKYSFTIRHENDTYSLLACDPQLNDTKELLHELNRTNGLFKFVRTMRERFQEVAAPGSLYQPRNPQQELSTISASAPAMSVSTNQSESSTHKEEYSDNAGRRSKKVNRGRVDRKELLSPESVRRSPRFKTLEQVRK
ncbi:Kinetochore protein SPC25 homolog, partial [Linum perenne]